MNTMAIILIGVGVFFWFWGGFKLLGRGSFWAKIHALGASDTVGTLLILAGVLLRSVENWNYILLAMGSVVFWGTALGYVLARFGARDGEKERADGVD